MVPSHPRQSNDAFSAQVIGLSMAILFWGSCYIIQPSKNMGRPFVKVLSRSRTLRQTYNIAMNQATNILKRPTAGRVTVSLAESLAVRAVIKPVTFPFKLWASYAIVSAVKGKTGNCNSHAPAKRQGHPGGNRPSS